MQNCSIEFSLLKRVLVKLPAYLQQWQFAI